ncbi:MAG: hypothetical protein II813_07895 [Spirochaetales bacterium]|nr:hypothetical protein [Spirochaetales bacterium]
MRQENITKEFVVSMMEILRDRLYQILEDIEPVNDDSVLTCRHYHGKDNFHLERKNGKPEYISPSKSELITKYAQERYNREIRRAAELEINQLDRCLKVLRNPRGKSDADAASRDFPDALKPFVQPMLDERYAAKWQESNIVVKKKRIHKEDNYHKFKTMRGDYVGSKSEVIIADRLFSNGIPYHYEVAFIPEARNSLSTPVYDEYGRILGYESLEFDPFSRDTLHPDFYVLNKRTRKAYFWEHLGRTNDPKYCVDNLNRLLRILDSGYTIGEEIIVTHEDQYHPLRTEKIDEIIEKYLK